MTFQEKYKALENEVIANLCSIKDAPKGLLPHMVFVEEENDEGHPVINEYELFHFKEDGACILKSVNLTKYESKTAHLSDIELIWLITVWGRYVELKTTENPSQPSDNCFKL